MLFLSDCFMYSEYTEYTEYSEYVQIGDGKNVQDFLVKNSTKKVSLCLVKCKM